MINSSVLVLNQNYEPLNVCRARRAVVMLWGGKAEVLENNSDVMHSPSISVRVPSVIRLVYMIKRPRIQRRLSRREVFVRDSYTCQYCGQETRDLTIDHVMPRFLGGEHTWENLVSACKTCNQRKAGRPPEIAGMKLRLKPFVPPPGPHYLMCQLPKDHPEWQKYVGNW